MVSCFLVLLLGLLDSLAWELTVESESLGWWVFWIVSLVSVGYFFELECHVDATQAETNYKRSPGIPAHLFPRDEVTRTSSMLSFRPSPVRSFIMDAVNFDARPEFIDYFVFSRTLWRTRNLPCRSGLL